MRDDLNFLTLFGKETDSRKLRAGEVLFAAGEEAHEMYIVRTGEVSISDGGVTFEVVGPGGLIGEMALVDRTERSATAKAVTDAEVIPINEKRFLWMVEQTPYFSIRVMKTLTARLRHTNALAKSLK